MRVSLRNVARLMAVAIVVMLAAGSDLQAQERKNPLLGPKSWAFQLDNLNPTTMKRIIDSKYDLVVLDTEKMRAADGANNYLTRAEIDAIKVKADGGRRMVIAYLSIGEAENNRYYWKPEWTKKRPSWIKKENKDWKGNFVVEYWQPVWQNIVFGSKDAFVDRALEQGFDGFYFDIVDAYYEFGDTSEMRRRMVDFVGKLSTYVRGKKPDIAILAQNAEELVDLPNYLPAIDGIAKESLFYGIKGPDIMNPKTDIDPSSRLLAKAKAAGKAIFAIEYLSRQDTYQDAVKRHGDLGFVLYIGPRGLAELNATGGPVTKEAATLKKSDGSIKTFIKKLLPGQKKAPAKS